jgi:hypothetical protein
MVTTMAGIDVTVVNTPRKAVLEMVADSIREAGILVGVFVMLDSVIFQTRELRISQTPTPPNVLALWITAATIVLVGTGMILERIRPEGK